MNNKIPTEAALKEFSAGLNSLKDSGGEIKFVVIPDIVLDVMVPVGRSYSQFIGDLSAIYGKGGGSVPLEIPAYFSLGGNAAKVALTMGVMVPDGTLNGSITFITRTGEECRDIFQAFHKREVEIPQRTPVELIVDGRDIVVNGEPIAAKSRINTAIELSTNNMQKGANIILSYGGDKGYKADWLFTMQSGSNALSAVKNATAIACCSAVPVVFELIKKKGLGEIYEETTVYFDTSFSISKLENSPKTGEQIVEALAVKTPSGNPAVNYLSANEQEIIVVASVLAKKRLDAGALSQEAYDGMVGSESYGGYKVFRGTPYDAALYVRRELGVGVILHTSDYMVIFETGAQGGISNVVPSFEIEPKFRTGAGDTFNGGLFLAMEVMRKKGALTPEECLLIGTATTCYYMETGKRPHAEDLRTFVQTHRLRELSMGTMQGIASPPNQLTQNQINWTRNLIRAHNAKLPVAPQPFPALEIYDRALIGRLNEKDARMIIEALSGGRFELEVAGLPSERERREKLETLKNVIRQEARTAMRSGGMRRLATNR